MQQYFLGFGVIICTLLLENALPKRVHYLVAFHQFNLCYGDVAVLSKFKIGEV
jgi:hypothetical protein